MPQAPPPHPASTLSQHKSDRMKCPSGIIGFGQQLRRRRGGGVGVETLQGRIAGGRGEGGLGLFFRVPLDVRQHAAAERGAALGGKEREGCTFDRRVLAGLSHIARSLRNGNYSAAAATSSLPSPSTSRSSRCSTTGPAPALVAGALNGEQ